MLMRTQVSTVYRISDNSKRRRKGKFLRTILTSRDWPGYVDPSCGPPPCSSANISVTAGHLGDPRQIQFPPDASHRRLPMQAFPPMGENFRTYGVLVTVAIDGTLRATSNGQKRPTTSHGSRDGLLALLLSFWAIVPHTTYICTHFPAGRRRRANTYV
ncbi:hypothetical protein BDY21DRAFT_66506 [Lineolata rhizophorae]|uniref:Uncharacterized protein n=1 Tax=Lineolata rhizophorae TaxID=578093 RepID=A0A6A6NUS2_9PEZI|nr:hypothetical protein BDY21DRAFT_66506 [Lineolata rhizophorae]